jgi:hypothetical protein
MPSMLKGRFSSRNLQISTLTLKGFPDSFLDSLLDVFPDSCLDDFPDDFLVDCYDISLGHLMSNIGQKDHFTRVQRIWSRT